MGDTEWEDDYDEYYEDDEDYFEDVCENEEYYEYATDVDGYEVPCNQCCGGMIVWNGKDYICKDCGEIMSREDFFNYIGADPLGEECLRCGELFPGCVMCNYGYVKDPLLE